MVGSVTRRVGHLAEDGGQPPGGDSPLVPDAGMAVYGETNDRTQGVVEARDDLPDA